MRGEVGGEAEVRCICELVKACKKATIGHRLVTKSDSAVCTPLRLLVLGWFSGFMVDSIFAIQL